MLIVNHRLNGIFGNSDLICHYCAAIEEVLQSLKIPNNETLNTIDPPTINVQSILHDTLLIDTGQNLATDPANKTPDKLIAHLLQQVYTSEECINVHHAKICRSYYPPKLYSSVRNIKSA